MPIQVASAPLVRLQGDRGVEFRALVEWVLEHAPLSVCNC